MTQKSQHSPASSGSPAAPAAADPSDPKRVRVNLTLSQDTHARIKVWCAGRRVTMQGAIEGMLDKAFAKQPGLVDEVGR